jgi:3-(3-hydroxy-phenyl)propionate hydroxylase
MATEDAFPVLVVGAGPSGLTAANLLGRYGIRTVLAEAKQTVNRRPRSTFVDDEFFRVLGTLDLADDVRRQSLGPATYEHYSPLGFLLSREEGQITSHNYPTRSAIFQPWFDQTLLDGVRRFDSVELLLGHEVLSLNDEGHSVEARLRTPSGNEITGRFSFVLAADGARSPIRTALGIDFEAVTPLEARSLRVDTEGDPDTTLVMRSRPTFERHAASFPAPNGRRYSFSVLPHETPEELLSEASLRKLISPFSDFDRVKVINKVVYTFRTRVAARFRKGRVFLLGDAAHVQPPAGSQGMNGGARDANNIAWKVAAVVRGTADISILDSYEEERYPAALEQVKRSGAGAAFRLRRKKKSKLAIAARDIALKVKQAFRPTPLSEELANALHVQTGQATHVTSGIVLANGDASKAGFLGRVLPNPWVEMDYRPRLLDKLLGHEFAIVGIDPETLPRGLDHPLWSALQARAVVLLKEPEAAASVKVAEEARQSSLAVARVVDDRLDRVREAHAGKWLVLRPDRIVAAIASVNELGAVAEALANRLGWQPHRVNAAA